MKKNELVKISLLEAISSLTGSSLIGFIIGVVSAASMTALFLMVVEIPFVLNVSLVLHNQNLDELFDNIIHDDNDSLHYHFGYINGNKDTQ